MMFTGHQTIYCMFAISKEIHLVRERFILKIHQNTNNYSYTVDVSFFMRIFHHIKVSNRDRNVNNVRTIEWLRERTEHLDIFLFSPSLNGVLFPMFCLLVEGECQILLF